VKLHRAVVALASAVMADMTADIHVGDPAGRQIRRLAALAYLRGESPGQQWLTSGLPDRPEIVRVDAAVHEVSGDEPDFTVAVLGLPAQQAERFLWSDTEMGVQHSLGLLDDGLRLERRMKVVNHLTAFPVHGRVVQCGPP
jgi:hypothetical protein